MSRKIAKREHESSIYEFLLASDVSVISMAQIWRTGLRMCCSGLYTEGRNIKRS